MHAAPFVASPRAGQRHRPSTAAAPATINGKWRHCGARLLLVDDETQEPRCRRRRRVRRAHDVRAHLGTKSCEEAAWQLLLRQLLAAATIRARAAITNDDRARGKVPEQGVSVHAIDHTA